MRTLQICTLAVLAVASTLPAQRGRGRDRDRDPGELKNFSWSQHEFDSEAVAAKVPFGVYLPAGYADDENRDKQWPLVIWLHGMFENHERFHTRGGAPVLDRAVTDGKLPPCVFVTANGGRTSMYVNREGQRWEDLITKDLLHHLDQQYRLSKDRDQRAIMGVSMGGMAALRIAFTQPDLFGAVAAHSAAVFAEDPEDLPPRLKQFATRLGLDEVFGDPIQKEPWQRANPLCIANRTDKADLHGLRIYFDAGTEDRYGFAAGNELLHEALDEKAIAHTWRLIQGGGHSWGNDFQDATLPHSFAFVGAMFRAAGERGAEPGGKPAGGGTDEKVEDGRE